MSELFRDGLYIGSFVVGAAWVCLLLAEIDKRQEQKSRSGPFDD